jgi:hypothetical protein
MALILEDGEAMPEAPTRGQAGLDRPLAAVARLTSESLRREPVFAQLHLRGANLGIPLAMMAYAAIVQLLCTVLGRPGDAQLGLYLVPFYLSYAIYAITIGSPLALRRLQKRSHRRLLWFTATWRLEEFAGRLMAALPFLLIWPIFMSGFTSIKNLLNDTLPFAWDLELIRLGLWIHFGKHLWQWLAIDSPAVTLTLEFIYAFWGVLLVAVPFAVTLRAPSCPKRTRFLASYLLVLVLLGNVVAAMFMSAGPFWLHFSGPHHYHGYSSLFDYLVRTDPDSSFSAVTYQHYLLEAHLHRIAWFGTGISAFPSIHVSIATLYVLFGWQFGRLARVASILFLLAIMVGSVHLGWHYALDSYGGMIGTAAIYYAVGWVQRRIARPAAAPALEPVTPSA